MLLTGRGTRDGFCGGVARCHAAAGLTKSAHPRELVTEGAFREKKIWVVSEIGEGGSRLVRLVATPGVSRAKSVKKAAADGQFLDLDRAVTWLIPSGTLN